MWPVFYKDNVIVGNEKSPVAICTLWSKKEDFSNFSRDKFSVIGNLYTNCGINYLIKNILANPRIKYIILCGKDLMKTGDVLINLLRNGLDEHYKIIGAAAYLDKTIPNDKIEILRKNVEIIDLRDEKNVKEKIEEILEKLPNDVDPFMDSLVVKEEEGGVESLTSDDNVFRFEGKIAEVWLRILDIMLKFGEV